MGAAIVEELDDDVVASDFDAVEHELQELAALGDGEVLPRGGERLERGSQRDLARREGLSSCHASQSSAAASFDSMSVVADRCPQTMAKCVRAATAR